MMSGADGAAITVLFVALAGYSAARLVRSRSVEDGVDHLCHLVMSLVMALMVWPWWSSVPAAPVAVVFGASALWFTLRLLRAHTDHVHDRGGHLVHAVMAVAMVWMAIAMVGMTADDGTHVHAAGMTSLAALGILLTVSLLVAAGALAVDGIALLAAGRRRWCGAGVDALVSCAMCLGMVAMTWPMSVG